MLDSGPFIVAVPRKFASESEGVIMAKGPTTQALFDVLDAQGDLTRSEAESHLKKKGKTVYEYFYGDHGKGTNRFNSFKNDWKKSRNMPIGKRGRKPGKSTKTTTTRRRRQVAATNPVTDFGKALAEVKSMGGISAVHSRITELQGLIDTVESVQEQLKGVA